MKYISMDYEEYHGYQLFYDPGENIMFDESGFIVFNIFDFINPNIFFLFKTKKQDMLTHNKDGCPVELYYNSDTFI